MQIFTTIVVITLFSLVITWWRGHKNQPIVPPVTVNQTQEQTPVAAPQIEASNQQDHTLNTLAEDQSVPIEPSLDEPAPSPTIAKNAPQYTEEDAQPVEHKPVAPIKKHKKKVIDIYND